MRDPFASIIASGSGVEVLDVPSINADASREIVERIEEARWPHGTAPGHRTPPTRCILVLGSAGAGKTHLVDRIRARYGEGYRAVTVLYRPETGADGTLRSVHTALFDALQHKPGASTTWTQASLIAGSILAGASGANAELPTSFLNQRRSAGSVDEALLVKAIESVRQRSREAWPEYLHRFLRLPFLEGPDAWAHESWLAAREPSEAELARVGEPARPEGERNGISDADVPRALRTLVAAASTVMPVVIFADQLELLVDKDGDAQRIRDHVKLFTTLRDTIPGLVLVQMALEGEWMARIRTHMTTGEQDRLEEIVRHLRYPTLEQRRALIEARLETIPPEAREGPPPWPLTPDELSRILAVEHLTPRALLQRCSQALRGEAEPPVDDASRSERLVNHLDEAYRRHTEESRAHIDLASRHGRGVDAPLLQDAMRNALGLVDGVATLARKVALASAVAFTARRGERAVDVILGQHSNGRSFSANVDLVFKALEAGAPTVLVREGAVAVPTSWDKSIKTLATIHGRWPGAFVELGRRDVTVLLAAQRLLAAVQSQDLLDDAGAVIPAETARAWLKDKESAVFAALAERLLSPGAAPQASPPQASPPQASPPQAARKKQAATAPEAPAPRDTSALVGELLNKLRVASVDGIARRLIDAGLEAPRAEVVKALRARADVRWIGETVVSISGPGQSPGLIRSPGPGPGSIREAP